MSTPEGPYARTEFSYVPPREGTYRHYGPGVPMPGIASHAQIRQAKRSNALRNLVLSGFAGLVILGVLAAGLILRGTSAYKPTDPSGVNACVSAFVKIHGDGITARVLSLPSSNKSVSMLEAANLKDLADGAVCGTLTLPDRRFATAQINAKTGDDYVTGTAKS